MAVTASMIKELRERSGAGMSDCKNALIDANGDMEEAAKLLRERGIAKAVKKEGRIAAEGLIGTYNQDGVGVLVELNCESDFVSRGEKFHEILDNIVALVAKYNPADMDALNALTLENGTTVADYISEMRGIIGEKIAIRRFVRFESAGMIQVYVHGEGRLGAMINIDRALESEEDLALAYGVAQQLAAYEAPYLSPADVPAEALEEEKNVLRAQILAEGKPEAIAEKMLIGRINKYYEENCLLKQIYVKGDGKTSVEKAIGKKFTVTAMACYEVGKGIEKKKNDLANEVQEQIEKMKK